MAVAAYEEPRRIKELEAYKRYDAMLNKTYGSVEIAGQSYLTSTASKIIDRLSYECGLNDWLDSEGLIWEE